MESLPNYGAINNEYELKREKVFFALIYEIQNVPRIRITNLRNSISDFLSNISFYKKKIGSDIKLVLNKKKTMHQNPLKTKWKTF